jgi:hypothetical protein
MATAIEQELRSLVGADGVLPGSATPYLSDLTEERGLGGHAEAVPPLGAGSTKAELQGCGRLEPVAVRCETVPCNGSQRPWPYGPLPWHGRAIVLAGGDASDLSGEGPTAGAQARPGPDGSITALALARTSRSAPMNRTSTGASTVTIAAAVSGSHRHSISVAPFLRA